MRIAHVISTGASLGGAEAVLAALVEESERQGIRSVVLNPFAPDHRARPLLHPGSLTPVLTRSCDRAWHIPGTRRWLQSELRRFQPDVVHVHLFHALVMVASLRRIDGQARILTHHHGDFLHAQGRRFEEGLDRFFGRRFDRVVAVSRAVEAFLVDHYQYQPSKVITIRNGFEGSPLPRVEPDLPTIVCVANFRPEKGHRVLLRALAIVRREISDVSLVLLGDGPLRDELAALADSLSIADAVRFEGSVEDVWPYLARSTLFCLPSLSEPLGIAIMEAMAGGVPVVASAVGGIPELVRHDETGRLAPPGDAGALARELLRLLRSPLDCERLASAALRVSSNWQMIKTARSYLDLYEEPTGGPPETS